MQEAGLQLSLLHPEAAFAPPVNPKKRRDTNNFSLVLSLRMGEIGFLFPADIEAPAETWLVKHCADRLRSTVLVAPHHGSKTSSSPAFIDAVSPEIVIFPAGNNRFIPHPDVLARYRQSGCRLVSTAQAGAISMTTDGRRLFLRFFKPDSLNEEIAIDGDI
jgi:competence protein ComEC